MTFVMTIPETFRTKQIPDGYPGDPHILLFMVPEKRHVKTFNRDSSVTITFDTEDRSIVLDVLGEITKIAEANEVDLSQAKATLDGQKLEILTV